MLVRSVEYLLYFGAFLASCVCLVKLEQNVAIFIFGLFILGNQGAGTIVHKIRFLYFFIFSIVIDGIGIAFWSAVWSWYYPSNYWERDIERIVIGAEVAIIIIKVIVVGLLYQWDQVARNVIHCQPVAVEQQHDL